MCCKMKKKSRKLILVRNDLLEQAAKITAKEGRTLFSFTNEVFEQAIEAYKMQVTLDEALKFYKIINIGKNMGCLLVPYDVFKHMAKRLCTIERKELLAEWYESGLWSGNYLKMRFHDQNPLTVVQSFLKAGVWSLDEFSINAREEKIDVKCFSPNLTLECTEMLAKFLEGILNALGYTIKSNTRLRGIIMMELESKKKEIRSELLIDAKS